VSRQVQLGKSSYSEDEIAYMESRSSRYGSELARVRGNGTNPPIREVAPDPTPDSESTTGPDSEPIDDDYDEMSVAELRAELKDFGLSSSGNKAELINRLREAVEA